VICYILPSKQFFCILVFIIDKCLRGTIELAYVADPSFLAVDHSRHSHIEVCNEMTLSNISLGILLISVQVFFLNASIIWGLLDLSFRYRAEKIYEAAQGWSVRREMSLSPGK